MTRLNMVFTNAESRGVSDVVGYVLIFGVILTVSTTAATIGFSGIQTQHQLEQISTIENGFELFDEDIETIQSHKDPKKQTPVNIRTGSIGYGDRTTITIGVRDNGAFTAQNTSTQTRTIRYRSEDTTITYDAGVIFNAEAGRGVISRSDTGAVISDEKAVIPIVIVNPVDADTAMSPSSEITIESTHVSDTQTTEGRTISTTGDPIWIEITSQQAAGWQTQLIKEGFTDVTRTGNTVRGKIATTEKTPTKATLSTTTIQTELKG